MKTFAQMVWVGALVGCAWSVQEKVAEIQASTQASLPSRYQFDYRVTNASTIGMLRVFDDRGSTYYQFRNVTPEALVISATTKSGETLIPHEVMGNYAVIAGVYRQSRIASASQPVVATKLGDIAPMADLGPVILPKPASQVVVEPPKPLPVAGPPVARPEPRLRTIRFARNSAQLGPRGREDLKEAIADARTATSIEVRVRAFYPTRSASVRLAKARAETVRDSLAKALDNAKIKVDDQGAAHALVAEVVLDTTEQQASAQAQESPGDPMPRREITAHEDAIHATMIATSFHQGGQP